MLIRRLISLVTIYLVQGGEEEEEGEERIKESYIEKESEGEEVKEMYKESERIKERYRKSRREKYRTSVTYQARWLARSKEHYTRTYTGKRIAETWERIEEEEQGIEVGGEGVKVRVFMGRVMQMSYANLLMTKSIAMFMLESTGTQ